MEKNFGFSTKLVVPAVVILLLVLFMAVASNTRSPVDLNSTDQRNQECLKRKGIHSYWTGSDCDCKKEDGYILSSNLTVAQCITFNEYCHFSIPGSVFSGVFNEASKENEENQNLLKCECTNGKTMKGSYFVSGKKTCACPDETCSLKNQCVQKPKNTTCNPISPKGWECKDGFVEGSLPNQTEVQCLTTQQCLSSCPNGTVMDFTYSSEKKCVCTPLSYR